MRLATDRFSVLLGHGFQESEARVYLALLDHPCLGASTLAKTARVPRSYLYNVLQDLHSRGLVDILLIGGKRSYRARPLDDFLSKKAEGLREQLAHLEGEMKTLREVFRPPPLEPMIAPEAGEVRVVLGRRAVAREIEGLLQSAKRRIVVECSQGGVERVGRHLQSLLGSKPEREHARVEVYLPPGAAPEFLGSNVAASPLVHAKVMSTPSPTLVFVADQDRMLVIHPVPDSADLRQGQDFAISTSDSAFIESRLQLLFDASERTKAHGSPSDAR